MQTEVIFQPACEEEQPDGSFEHIAAGFWTVIDTEINDGPFPTAEAAHAFMASR